MECPNCGSYNADDEKATRCSICNERLPHRCPYCGSRAIVYRAEEKDDKAPIGCLLDPFEWLIFPLWLLINAVTGDKKKDVWYCSDCSNKLRRVRTNIYLPSRRWDNTGIVVGVICIFFGLMLIIPAITAYPSGTRTMLLGIGWTLIVAPIITIIVIKVYRARRR